MIWGQHYHMLPPSRYFGVGSCPIRLPADSVNHRLASGPLVISCGWQGELLVQAAARANSWMCPVGVMRPMAFPCVSVNQRLPSGPLVIAAGPHASGLAHVVGRGN